MHTMNTKKLLTLLIGLPGIAIIVGILIIATHSQNNANANTSTEPRINVIATFYPVYYFTSRIAGDDAVVTNLTPAGTEPHDFEPTPSDLLKLQDADLVISNGADLESWLPAALDATRTEKRKVSEAVSGITLRTATEDEHAEEDHQEEHGAYDPHVWLDPVLARQMVLNIQQALTQADPANEAAYAVRANALLQDLSALDTDFTRALATCQKDTAIFAHDAFNYLAARYGFTAEAVSGLSPEEEPTPKQLSSLATLAKDKKVTTIFFEELTSPKLAETLANEVGATARVLSPIEGLTEEQQSGGVDYLSLMRDNMNALSQALACR